ncbi:MAG: hypothetical protein NZM15_08500, partial [Flavobacteriales bacterium]|nr:hypothetical protein [Flavobacteriales bacterium]MDW8432726.1 hypothetical protein [Flavobacteriales bacterium]
MKTTAISRFFSRVMAWVFGVGFLTPVLRAQLNYQLQYITNNYETLSAPTLIHGTGLDDNTASIPLPFNFTYAGTNYTTSHFVRVCVNGFAVLNTTSATSPTTLTNQLGNNTVGNFDLLAPWW